MKLTADIVVIGTGANAATAASWAPALAAAAAKYGIDQTPQRLAAWLANIGVESAGLTAFVENMNYSTPQRLAQVWPTRFAVDSQVQNKIPNSTAYLYVNKPVDLANFVYANRLGNGDVSSGDGWKFRGQGPIGLTGRDNFMRFFASIGLPLQTDPASVTQPENGSLSAAWIFSSGNAMKAVDAGSFDMCVKGVNGALPCAANQGPLRQSRYEVVLAALMAQPATPPAPAPKKPAPAAPKTTPAASPQAQDKP